MKIYLASPFFSQLHLANVVLLEDAIVATGLELLSPRRSGIVLKDLTQDERNKVAAKVYQMNCDWIEECDAMLAMIDDYDPGTIWEMGRASRIPRPIYSVSFADHGVNVMLQGCVAAHARGIEQVREMLGLVRDGKSIEEFRSYAAT